MMEFKGSCVAYCIANQNNIASIVDVYHMKMTTDLVYFHMQRYQMPIPTTALLGTVCRYAFEISA